MKFVKICALIILIVCGAVASRKIHSKKSLTSDEDIPCSYTLVFGNECSKYKKAECDFKWKVCRLKDGQPCRNNNFGDDYKTGCLSKSECVSNGPDTKEGVCKSRDSLYGKLLRTANHIGIPINGKNK
jgi:hypothetical protein